MFNRIFLSSSSSKGWIAVLTPTADRGFGTDIALDSSGNIYAIGSANDINGGTNDLSITKVNTSGVLQWQRRKYTTYAGKLSNGKIAISPNSTIYILNNTGSYNPFTRSVINKYNSSGSYQSSETYYYYGATYSGSIISDASDNTYSLHTRDMGEAGGYQKYAFLRKADSSLNGTWVSFIETTSFPAVTGGASAAFDTSGNIFITNDVLDLNTNDRYVGILKYDTSGNKISHKHISTLTYSSIAIDTSGNIFVGGSYWDGSTYRGYIAKLNSSYVIQWQRNLYYSSARLYAQKICLDQSGNVYIPFSTDNGTTYILKYNTSGSLQWQRKFDATGSEDIVSVVHDGVSSFYITGTTYSNGTARQYFAKLPDDGTSTGTYTVGGYSYSYTASTLTDSAASLSTVNLTVNIVSVSFSEYADNLWVDASGTQTLGSETI